MLPNVAGSSLVGKYFSLFSMISSWDRPHVGHIIKYFILSTVFCLKRVITWLGLDGQLMFLVWNKWSGANKNAARVVTMSNQYLWYKPRIMCIFHALLCLVCQFNPYTSALLQWHWDYHIDGLVQEICNFNVLAVEIHLSFSSSSIWLPQQCQWSNPEVWLQSPHEITKNCDIITIKHHKTMCIFHRTLDSNAYT